MPARQLKNYLEDKLLLTMASDGSSRQRSDSGFLLMPGKQKNGAKKEETVTKASLENPFTGKTTTQYGDIYTNGKTRMQVPEQFEFIRIHCQFPAIGNVISDVVDYFKPTPGYLLVERENWKGKDGNTRSGFLIQFVPMSKVETSTEPVTEGKNS